MTILSLLRALKGPFIKRALFLVLTFLASQHIVAQIPGTRIEGPYTAGNGSTMNVNDTLYVGFGSGPGSSFKYILVPANPTMGTTEIRLPSTYAGKKTTIQYFKEIRKGSGNIVVAIINMGASTFMVDIEPALATGEVLKTTRGVITTQVQVQASHPGNSTTNNNTVSASPASNPPITRTLKSKKVFDKVKKVEVNTVTLYDLLQFIVPDSVPAEKPGNWNLVTQSDKSIAWGARQTNPKGEIMRNGDFVMQVNGSFIKKASGAMAEWTISLSGTGEEFHQVDISSIITPDMELRPFIDALLVGKDFWIKRLASCGQFADGEGAYYEVMIPGKRLFYVTSDTSCGSEGCGLYISIFFKKNAYTPECTN